MFGKNFFLSGFPAGVLPVKICWCLAEGGRHILATRKEQHLGNGHPFCSLHGGTVQRALRVLI